MQEAFGIGSANLNAQSYEQALLVPFCFELGRPVLQAYVIGRKYERLRVLAGLADDSPEEIPLTFAVYGDGKRLFSKVAERAGKAIPIDISVKNVLRLELVIFAAEGSEQVCNPDLETFVWASAQLDPISR
ncbi:NPCBM/NEW2 domain-containing protein [Nonomuraea sp. NPDC003560]|uniref:NPCBM/NEW2 domain-containing protein n=1 Tax=Nonomuraea sp. NPDC003560 TaxID=3364341 RepID=UPI0036B885F6